MLEKDNMIATLHCTLDAHSSDVNGVAFSGLLLASVSTDKTARLWHVDDYKELFGSPLNGHKYAVRGCTFSPDQTTLATFSTDGFVVLWNCKTGEKKSFIHHKSKSSIRICVFSPDGKFLATGSDDESICIWDARSKSLIRSISGPEASMVALAFTPDSSFLVSGSVNGDLRIWDAKYGHSKPLFMILEGHDLGVCCCVFSKTYGSAGSTANGNQTNFLMASSGYDNNVKLWDFLAETGSSNVDLKLRDTLAGHVGPVFCCCFDESGKVLASASGDKSVRLWDTFKGELIHVIEAHSRFVTSCSFSMDGKFLATGSNDKLIKIWKMTTESQLSGSDCVADMLLPIKKKEEEKRVRKESLWTTEDISSWLEEIGLGIYKSTFMEHAIDGFELQTLSHQSLLVDLGIKPLGHRNKILRGIEDLNKRPLSHSRTSEGADELASPVLVEDNSIPDEYLCPITREIMYDPVIASDGFTYERNAITSWVQSGKRNSPMTNDVFNASTLTPNRSLKMLIHRHLNK